MDRVVTQKRQNPCVGLGSNPRSNDHHLAGLSDGKQSIEIGGPRRHEGRLTSGIRMRQVSKAVENDQCEVRSASRCVDDLPRPHCLIRKADSPPLDCAAGGRL